MVGRCHDVGARRQEVRCLLPELRGSDRVWGSRVEHAVVSEPRKLVWW
ncbi:hypothetical protein LINPERPRIM_LOCUS3916 [Linum perenne]